MSTDSGPDQRSYSSGSVDYHKLDHCRIDSTLGVGVYANDYDDSLLITDCQIMHSTDWGIADIRRDKPCRIQNCQISYNALGGIQVGNTYTDALYYTPGNDLHSNGNTNLINGSSRVIQAQNNYWGSLDPSVIASTIVGNVVYEPWSPGSNFVPTLLGPLDGQIVTLPINFDWSSVSGATRYRILISTDPSMNDIVCSYETSSSNWTVESGGCPFTASTPYYWTVTASAAGMWGPATTSWSFEVQPSSITASPVSHADGFWALVGIPEVIRTRISDDLGEPCGASNGCSVTAALVQSASSLELFDDGMHSDDQPDDGTYGNEWIPSQAGSESLIFVVNHSSLQSNPDTVDGYVYWPQSTQSLRDAVAQLREATESYLTSNAGLAWEIYESVLDHLYAPDKEIIRDYTTGLIREMENGGLETGIAAYVQNGFETVDGLEVASLVKSLLFDAAEARHRGTVGALASHIAGGTRPSPSDFLTEYSIGPESMPLTVNDAILNLNSIEIPEYVPDVYSLNAASAQIDRLATALRATSAGHLSDAADRHAIGVVWRFPGSCNPAAAGYAAIGCDVDWASEYLDMREELEGNDRAQWRWKMFCIPAQGTLLATALVTTGPTFGSAGAASLLVYSAVSAVCDAADVYLRTAAMRNEAKMAHWFERYVSAWPTALWNAYVAFNSLEGGLVESLTRINDLGQCSRSWSIDDVTVEDVCLPIGQEQGDEYTTVTVSNRGDNDGEVRAFLEVYLSSDAGNPKLADVRFPPETYSVAPGGSAMFSASVPVALNSWWARWWTYEARWHVLTPGGEVMAAKRFYCDKLDACLVRQADVASRDIARLVINEGQEFVDDFTTGAQTLKTKVLAWWPGSDVNLHVYDQAGNHVGYNETLGVVEIQILGATYSGPNSRPEIIVLPQSGGASYTYRIDGTNLPDSEMVQVSVEEYGNILPILTADREGYRLIGYPQDTLRFSVALSETGEINPISGLSVSAPAFEDSNGVATGQVTVAVEPLPDGIPAGSSSELSMWIVLGDSVAAGHYLANLDINSDANNLSLEIALEVQPTLQPGDLDKSGVYDIIDVVMLVDYAFRNAAPPFPVSITDVNCDLVAADILDVVRLIDHTFRNGLVPSCP